MIAGFHLLRDFIVGQVISVLKATLCAALSYSPSADARCNVYSQHVLIRACWSTCECKAMGPHLCCTACARCWTGK